MEPIESKPSIVQAIEDERVFEFFSQTQKELRIESSKQLIRVVGRLLGWLHKCFPVAEGQSYLKKFPRILQLLGSSNWKVNDQCFIEHLDELAERLASERNYLGRLLFRSEIEALEATIVILRNLDKCTGLFAFDKFSPHIVKEIRQVPQERGFRFNPILN